jgi:hypothetical protein
LVAALAGCASGGAGGGTGPVAAAPRVLRGAVHGGQQPIAGATIQLYAIEPGAPASAAVALMNPAPTTNAQGYFSLTSDYACPYSGAQVYIVSTGGNTGGGPSTDNPHAALMAAIGPCATPNNAGTGYTLDPNIFISINEVTTVGSIYALAPFMSDYAHAGFTSSTGIYNAFSTSAMLMDFAGGATPGPQLSSAVSYDPATGFPVMINTIAGAIASCINSIPPFPDCQTLFRLTTIGGVAPSDTLGATLALAKNPGISPAGIMELVSAKAPYQPVLANPPNDWTISLNYTGLNLVSPTGLAIDGYGDIWVADAASTNVTKVYSAYGAQSYGTPSAQFGGGGILGAQSLAIDASNNVWIANTAGNSVVELDFNGNILSGAGYTAGGINAPIAIAIDNNGAAWVANYNGNSITQLMSDGSASSSSPITSLRSGSISQPTGIAFDAYNGLIWVSNSGLQSSLGLTTQIAAIDQYGLPRIFTSQTVQNPLGLAVDDVAHGVWVASNGTSQLGEVGPGGSVLTGEAVNGGGLNQPAGVAVDGNEQIWVTNDASSGSVSKFSASGTALSPATGFGGLQSPMGVAVDLSGNLWTANSGSGTLTEFVGLAAQTAAPIITKNVYGLAKKPQSRGK